MSDTPETNSKVWYGSSDVMGNIPTKHTNEQYVEADFARKLERERNEARAESERMRQAGNLESRIFSKVEAERDQLRKVADELAKAADDFLSIRNESKGVIGWHPNGDILTWEECESVGDLEVALNNYDLLPHVTERNKAK